MHKRWYETLFFLYLFYFFVIEKKKQTSEITEQQRKHHDVSSQVEGETFSTRAIESFCFIFLLYFFFIFCVIWLFVFSNKVLKKICHSTSTWWVKIWRRYEEKCFFILFVGCFRIWLNIIFIFFFFFPFL